MQNIKLILAYDGTFYYGWQNAPEVLTIEGTLKPILEKILQQEITLQAASRTDAGVHAEGQVANFFLLKERNLDQLQKSLNQLLPKDIRIEKLEEMEAKFHPTLDAKGKEYHYHLTLTQVQLPFQRHYAWHFPFPLDFQKMEKAAKFFIGTHDFQAFCNATDPKPSDTVRTLSKFELISEGSSLRFEICGNRFLYKMIRNLIGTLVYIGCGKLSLDEARELPKKKDRTLAGVTAPAHGLILKEVFY